MSLLRNIFQKYLLITISLMFSSASFTEPMDDVFPLFDMGGGTVSGKSSATGYYVVAMGFSGKKNENKGLEEARLDALRKLNEMINGVTTSGTTSASMKYITVSDGGGEREFSEESFVDVVNTRFKGTLSAVKELKSGSYDGNYFVAMVITETDVNQVSRLRGGSAVTGSGNTEVISTGGVQTVAKSVLSNQFVESKGLADMKHGEAEARKACSH
ncbi:hypothetical protein BCU51_015460 [Vibrio lentus]|uniref:hypothetical protein n=1 Tax=Vibrio lentus TaxID=136468 RepID=UPI0039A74FB0